MARARRVCEHCGKPWSQRQPGPASRLAPFIAEIRARRAAGESLKVLASDYGADESYICKLTRGRKLAAETRQYEEE